MWKLRIEDDEGEQTEVPIIRDEITIGRKEGNTIRLTERNVSRRHARLVREQGALFVEDVAARYGIKKNGEKIQERAEFTDQDTFLIGDYRLTLKAEGAEASDPMEEASLNGASANGVGDFASSPTEVKPLKASPQRAHEGTEILPAMPAKLVIVSSNFAGQEFPLSRKEMVIGRGEDCDIIIDHRSVSQKHAKIVREGGANYQIVDLNSKNGVRIGGEKYNSTYIKRGDIVELGHVKFRFVEPGENYVFTPQSVEDAPAPVAAAGSSSSNLPYLVGAGVVGLLGIVALVVVLNLGGDDGDGGVETGADAQAATVQNEEGGDDEVEPVAPPEEGDDRVASGITRAEDHIDRGDVEKALGVLEGLKEYAEPTPEEKRTIEKLVSKARNERPFRKHYIVAKDDLEEKNYLDALRSLEKIPDHSLFAKLASDSGMRSSAIAGILEEAQAALEEGRRDTASALANEVLTVDPEQARAQAILKDLETRRVASRANPPSRASDDGGRDPKPRKKDPPPRRQPKRSSRPSPEEAQALVKSAQKNLFKGDSQGAIRDCKKALRGGRKECHRIMGLAYNKLGNKRAACASFERALEHNPTNAPGIKDQMAKIGCK